MLPLKFFTRPKIKPGLVLTERDRALVRWCYELRAADSTMLALLVESSHDRATRRLHLLWAHEFVDRPHGQFFLKVKEERRHAVYSLGREGARLIAEEDRVPFSSLRWQYAKNHEAKERYLKHTLEIAKFRTALTLALRKPNSTLVLKRWISGMDLAKESVKVNGRRIPVCPDGFFSVFDPVAKRTSHFMLEMDLGTMTVGRFIKKIQGYRAYWETGRHEIQYQIPAFQVLTVTTSEARLAHLFHETRRLYQKSRQFLFTTINRYSLAEPERVLSSPLFSVPANEQPTVLIEPVIRETRQGQLLPLASWAPPLRQRVPAIQTSYTN